MHFHSRDKSLSQTFCFIIGYTPYLHFFIKLASLWLPAALFFVNSSENKLWNRVPWTVTSAEPLSQYGRSFEQNLDVIIGQKTSQNHPWQSKSILLVKKNFHFRREGLLSPSILTVHFGPFGPSTLHLRRLIYFRMYCFLVGSSSLLHNITVPHPPDAKKIITQLSNQNPVFSQPIRTYLSIHQADTVPPISLTVFSSVVELPFLSFVKLIKF